MLRPAAPPQLKRDPLGRLAKHRPDRRGWRDRSDLVFGYDVGESVRSGATRHRVGKARTCGSGEDRDPARGCSGECGARQLT